MRVNGGILMATNRIGWPITDYAFAIKQGSSGSWTFTLTVTNADGTALPTYDGWTAAIKLVSVLDGRTAINMTPSVVGAGAAHTLAVAFSFSEDDTASLTPAQYIGDLFLTQPTTGDKYSNANITLTVERSYSE